MASLTDAQKVETLKNGVEQVYQIYHNALTNFNNSFSVDNIVNNEAVFNKFKTIKDVETYIGNLNHDHIKNNSESIFNERMKHLKKCCQVKDLNSCDSAKETRLVKCIRMNDNYTFYYYTNCYYDLNQKKILISTQILMNTLKIRNKNNNNIKIIENKEEGDIIVVKYEI